MVRHHFGVGLDAAVGKDTYWGRDVAASVMISHASSTSRSPVCVSNRCEECYITVMRTHICLATDLVC
jgi:hypothetical protein